LNAKHHAREAEIVAQAGQKGAVTISTNMAGRGTDIKLGAGVVELGGLFILGTERHEARRIDNQLRGRAGRQGDPGETQFFVSMEDDIMRVFGGSRMKSLMERLNVPEEEAIENRLVSRALEGAQERVEGYYFDMRKQVLSYDDVMNRQRNAIYSLRRSILRDNNWREPGVSPVSLSDYVDDLLSRQASELVAVHAVSRDTREWNIEEIAQVIHALSGVEEAVSKPKLQAAMKEGEEESRLALQEAITVLLEEKLAAKETESGEGPFRELLKAAAMRAIDVHWMDHLDTMDYLRTGIGLRGYGQRDPLVEYQKEGHELFQKLMGTINATFMETVFKAQMVRTEAMQGQAQHQSALEPHRITGPAQNGGAVQPQQAPDQKTLVNPYKDVGRNDPCPCGSGKKFKKCHGK
jgi:preprotein translocase subunit SecA